MPLQTKAAGFNETSATYEGGRPEYPAQALRFTFEALGIDAASTVVDLGQAQASSPASSRSLARASWPSNQSRACAKNSNACTGHHASGRIGEHISPARPKRRRRRGRAGLSLV